MEKVIYFAPGLKPVFKHGTHDQSTHGSWANSSERSAKEIEVQGRISNIKVETFPPDEYGESGSRVTAEYQTKSGEKIKLVHDNTKFPDGKIEMDTYAKVAVEGGYKQIGFLNVSRDAKSYSQYGANIDSVSVEPEYKRQGIGTAMLNLARSYSQDGVKIEHSGQLSDDAKGWSSIVKHLSGQHDQRTHGSWSGGAGVDITSKLDKVFYASALIRDRPNKNEETQAVLDEMKAHQLAQGGAVGDNTLKIIAERQGFTDKPKSVATLEDLQKIQSTEGGTIVFRGIADYAQTDGGEVTYTGKQAADDFRNGDYYAGWGMFGNGIYTTVKLDGAVAYANLTDDKYNRKGNGSVVSMLIPKDAKRASREVVRETMKSVADATAPSWGLRPTHRNDLGRALAAKGYQYYDAGDVQNNKIGQIVILDRSMLTVAVEDKK